MNGGYIILDCGALDLAVETKQTITGLTAKLANAIKSEKPIYALIGGTSPISVYTQAGSVTGTTDLIFGTTIITVDAEDGATVSSAIPTTSRTTTKKG
jgi:hypothetical protein